MVRTRRQTKAAAESSVDSVKKPMTDVVKDSMRGVQGGKTVRHVKKTGSKKRADNRTVSKQRIESIRDFKKIGEKVYYLVHRTGTTAMQDTWEAEQAIESLEVLSEFQQRVQENAGYAIHGTDMDVDHEAAAVASSRFTRVSKARAMLRLTDKATAAIDPSDDSDSAQSLVVRKTGSKRKSTSSSKAKTTTTGSAASANKKPRGLEARKAAEAEARQDRKSERSVLVETLEDHAVLVDETDCCLRCATLVYRQAIETQDVERLKVAIQDRDNVPHWSTEDVENWGDSVLYAAMKTGNPEIPSTLLAKEEGNEKRVQVPEKYLYYGSNTGYVGRYTFGHTVRKVNEARGNRQGDSAFFRTAGKNPLEVDINRQPEGEDVHRWMPSLQDCNLPENMAGLFSTGRNNYYLTQKGFYFTVASGNRALAANFVKRSAARTGFNHLHSQVLQFTTGQNLTTYRRNQILKKAHDAGCITPLQCAAINPSSRYLKELFEQLTPAERLEADEFGRTVAHFAAASTTPDCLEYLISQEYNLSAGDKYKITPLIQAARFGRPRNVRLLLTYLSKDTLPSSEFADHTLLRQKWRPLHYAAYFGHAETCRELIDCGATVEAADSGTHATPLMFAAQRGHLECVKVFVEHGQADLEARDRYGRTPLHLASIGGHVEVAKYLLLQGVDANAADTSLNRPMHYAAGFGRLRLLQLLIHLGQADSSAANVWRTTPCSVANLKGHIAIVQYLLNNTSIDVNFKDEDGMTMLHRCVSEKVESKLEMEQTLRKAKLLISKNANVDMKSVDGETVLHCLVRPDDFRRNRPAGWTAADTHTSNETPLELDDKEGIDFQKKLVHMVIAAGADIDAVNLNGETPLAVAMSRKNHHLVAALLEHDAKFWDAVDARGNNFFHYLFSLGAALDKLPTRRDVDRVRKGRHESIVQGIWDHVVRLSARASVDDIHAKVNAPNYDGYPPLLAGVCKAVDSQRAAVKAEKNRVRSKYYSTQQNFSSKSQGFEREEAVFEFRFQHWFEVVHKIIESFRPDMRATVQLPKDFLKKNPKPKVSDFPQRTGYSALHLASASQDAGLLRFLMNHGCDPNQCVKDGGVFQNASGDPPMLLGFFRKRFSVQEYLPDDSLQTIEHSEKLFNIIKPDFEQLLPDAIRAYLDHGANPCILNKSGLSALIKAASELDGVLLGDMSAACVKYHLEGVDSRDKKDLTALMHAVDATQSILKTKNEGIDLSPIQHLLSAGANPNKIYRTYGDSVFMKTLRLGYPPLVDIMIKYTKHVIDHTIVNKELETPAIVASKAENMEITKSYYKLMVESYQETPFNVNCVDREKNTALSLAAKSGDEDAVKALLRCGADPNHAVIDRKGNIKLPLLLAVEQGYMAIAQLLLEAKANVNSRDHHGRTSLHYAALAKKHTLIKLLLDVGADVHALDNKQRTALHLALEQTKTMTNASLRMEKLLIQAGADLNAVDVFGRTPLHVAFVGLDMIPDMRSTVLTHKKAKKLAKRDMDARRVEEQTDEYVRKYGFGDDKSDELIQDGARLYLQAKEAEKKSKESDNDLVITTEEEASLAVYSGMQWEADNRQPEKSDPVDIVMFLLGFPGIQCDVADKFGRTPLHYAACVGAFSCTSYLLEKGVDGNARDSDENTPLQLALLYSHVDFAAMLCNQGVSIGGTMTLPRSEPVTTLNYCLSKGFMNIAYMLLKNGNHVLESLRDALRTGRFHVSDILLDSENDAVLSGVTDKDQQNLWHIVADFTPFNREIWEEYLPDIMHKLTRLLLDVRPDAHKRSPVHYAASHGQSTLLSELIKMDACPINQLDEDGLSEIWYAVNSNNTDCVKILLDAGADVNLSNNQEKDSVLLIATKNKNEEMLKLLLKANANTDADSQFGRKSAVMQACLSGSDALLKLLIDAGADINQPSMVTRTHRNVKKKVKMYPIFAAKESGLKALINAGVDLNVLGPDEEPWEHRSFFMDYSYRIQNVDMLKFMLGNGVDINLCDNPSGRTIFYQYLFDRIEQRRLPVPVYEYMLQHGKPDVNRIDSVNGMTPLEYAIRQHDRILVERFLELGANPNMVSFAQGKENSADLYTGGKLNALFHAAAQNDLAILQSLCERSHHQIDFHARDDEGRTLVSFIASLAYSHENVDMLQYIISAYGENYLAFLEMRDHHGKRAADYAFSNDRKSMYSALLALGVAPVTETADPSTLIGSETMDLDYITLQSTEEDAEAERAILEAELKAKSNNEDTQMQDSEDDDKPKVDPYSKMEKIGRIVEENGRPLDIMVQKIDVSTGYYGCNLFYKLSVIHNTVLDVYVLWTRWGSFGEEGMHQKTPFLDKEEAIAEFKSIFKSKTGNHWEMLDEFVPRPGRFELMQARPPRKPVILKDFKFLETAVPSQLPSSLYETLQVMVNFANLNTGYRNLELDIPVGQVPQRCVDEAFEILKKLEKISERYNQIYYNANTKELHAEKKELAHKIAKYSNKYYRLLPRNTDKTSGIKPLVRQDQLSTEWGRLLNLSHIIFTTNVILAAKRRASEIHPLDYCYRALSCQLTEVGPDSSEYRMVKKYMSSTSGNNPFDIVHLFAVERQGEAERFKRFEKNENRKLLWHGSNARNFMGILKQGIRRTPATALQNGAMFGEGIYFADMFCKAIKYAGNYNPRFNGGRRLLGQRQKFTTDHPAYALVLLCEVALGQECEMVYYDADQFRKGVHLSVKGVGREVPNPANTVIDEHGTRIMMGPPMIQNEVLGETPYLERNEYIVYDESQVKIRYMVLVQDRRYCSLCQECGSNERKKLCEYDETDENFAFPGLSEFEGWLCWFSLKRAGKSLQAIFKEKLDDFIDSRKYTALWDPPVPLTRDSKVCKDCAANVICRIAVEYVRNMSDGLPETFQKRPVCRYGQACHDKENLEHAKQYQHWFSPEQTEDGNNDGSADEENESEEDDDSGVF